MKEEREPGSGQPELDEGQPDQESARPEAGKPGETSPVRDDAGESAAGHDAAWETVSRARRLAEAAEKTRQEREAREEKQEQAKRQSLLAKIQSLDVGEKAKLARHGDKECRSILIRDANKLIAQAVLTNPKITIQEIEMIAASRNVNDDVLKEIARNKDWCKSYTVIYALVNNPKTAVPVSLTFLPKLLTNHLRSLAKSKGVPEAIRAAAKRLVEKRQF